MTATVLNGTLTLGANPQNVTVTGSGTAMLTMTGTLAQFNAALGNLQYLGNQDYNGTDTLTIVTNDAGNYGDADGDGIPGKAWRTRLPIRIR